MTLAATTPTPIATSAHMVWSNALNTGDARIDATHQEFLSLINQILATPEDVQLPVYKAF